MLVVMRVGKALALLATGATLGAVVTAAVRKQTPVAAELAPAEAVPPFEVVDGLVVVRDAQVFLKYVATMLGPKIPTDTNADDVLERLLGGPPAPGTEAAHQWAFMRERIAALLEQPTPPTPRLRVVS